ncbi:MAG: hypothetical protein VYB58_00940, partial [Verrucomicrobiota bacterium]|nr:hypothetical protein [Verrucomicrobiota bacterium]
VGQACAWPRIVARHFPSATPIDRRPPISPANSTERANDGFTLGQAGLTLGQAAPNIAADFYHV